MRKLFALTIEYRQAGILVSHTGSLHASVPVMAITQPT